MSRKSYYMLIADGSFLIHDYNHTKPFSNFFPGIAGLWGIPMWVFYVNRGQCISSFGIQSKDKAILEFQPANKAYRLTSLQGFRTFLKVKRPSSYSFWEPFQNNLSIPRQKTHQRMHVTSHDLTIEDVHPALGLKIQVKYFTLPEEPLAALIREVTVKNISKRKLSLEMIDGLPLINCYGLEDWASKNMSRTAEAWINVSHIKEKVPYYHLKVQIKDTPQVYHIKEGNFYFSFVRKGNRGNLLKPIVEAACVFGDSFDYRMPEIFLSRKNFNAPLRQQTSNRTPSAMTFDRFTLRKKEERTFVSCFGFAYDWPQLNQFASKAIQRDFIVHKENRNKATIAGVKQFAFTKSSSPAFDGYCQQTFLDNVLRGGLPISLKTQDGSVAFNVYSRKHGDLERDYNYFVLAQTYFSQGNGHYRDVSQNRRNDVWFNSDVRQTHIMNFLNLIQADGYNPLVIKGVTFSLDNSVKLETIVQECVRTGDLQELRSRLQKGFQPGELLNFVLYNDIKLKVSVQDFLERVLGAAHKQEPCEHGDGFWTDHWTYTIDLLESFCSIYPDELESLLLGEKKFTFYHNDHYVLPREQRYILTNMGVRQYHAVCHDPKMTKAQERGHKLRTQNGEGEIYRTQLISKLLCLAANKAASLDPSGMGIEMEANKPNWYDALNGLPGLLGSSISEAFELKRLCLFVLRSIERLDLDDGLKIPIYVELYSFIARLVHILSTEKDSQGFWDKSNHVKEDYRYRIRGGIDGQENEITIKEIKDFLQLVIAKVNQGILQAKDSRGLYRTYFYHEVIEYEKFDKTDVQGNFFVRPLRFKRHSLPLFLEGFVHALRVIENRSEAKNIYQKVRGSALFDKKLKMYKVNEDLSKETEEIGRTRIFPRGWLENESVWLHMEYKFLLELLRCGLYEEFYENFKNVLIPFLKPEQYGRSTLENSSFIVSSAHEDVSLHGQGFVARLSGSTAEFLHMWLIINLGLKPFGLDKKGKLTFTLDPILPGWLFTKKASKDFPKNSYAFNLLGTTLVRYHNPQRKDTFGSNHARLQQIILTYHDRKDPVVLSSSTITTPYSYDIRSGKVSKIDVELR